MPIEQAVFEQLRADAPTLVELDLSYKKLTIDDLLALISSLANNTHLQKLNIDGNDLGQEGGKLLAQISQLTTLIASNCQLGDEGIGALSQHPQLKSLVLMNNQIGLDGAKLLAQNTQLKYLNLASNQIPDEGAIELAKNTHLEVLNLNHNRIGTKGAVALANNETLKELYLGYNKIREEGAASFAKSTGLRSLSLAGNNITFPGIQALATNQTLEWLDVSYNLVDDKGAKELARHPKLTYLDISYNQIGYKGAHDLSFNRNLTMLMAGYNRFENEGAVAIARIPTLIKLDLTGNYIGFRGAYALSRNEKLESLCLTHNQIGDAGAIILADNAHLTELLLSYNNIGVEGARALSENKTLKTLSLNYNQIGQLGAQALLENTTLTSLSLSPEQPPEFTDENLDTIFLLSETFLCILSHAGIIQFFNPAFARVLGYPSDELLSQPFIKFLHPDDQSEVEKLFTDPQTHINKRFEFRSLSKDGFYRIISWSWQIRHNRIYTMGTDITEKKQAGIDLATAEARHLNIKLLEAKTFAEQQTAFIAQLSHEVRNPLGAINGLRELLESRIKEIEKLIDQTSAAILPEAWQQLFSILHSMKGYLRDIDTCVTYQSSILEASLDTARITEKKFLLTQAPFDLSQAVWEVVTMLRVKAEEKNLVIQSHVPETLLLKGDQMRIKQILVNLITNAIKFTEQGHIDVKVIIQQASAESTHILIEVTDTGVGLNSEEIANLFKRFSQVLGGEYTGSGLGLYLMKQLANLMGGDISITSEKGKGSTFSVTLVLRNLSEQEMQQFQRQQEKVVSEVASPMISGRFRKVLIVDDNAINRKVLGKQLADAGYSCEFAANGQEALDRFDEQTFDIILMDMQMPVMDGFTATAEIRKREQTKALPRTPIVSISANVFDCEEWHAHRLNVDACIIKPFKIEEVLQKIEELIKRTSRIQAESEKEKLSTLTQQAQPPYSPTFFGQPEEEKEGRKRSL